MLNKIKLSIGWGCISIYLFCRTLCNGLRLPGVVIHFEYNKSESANVIEMLFKQIYE